MLFRPSQASAIPILFQRLACERLKTMLKTFVLIALLNGQAYEVDYDLSAADCAYAVQGGISSIEIKQGIFVPATSAELICEESN